MTIRPLKTAAATIAAILLKTYSRPCLTPRVASTGKNQVGQSNDLKSFINASPFFVLCLPVGKPPSKLQHKTEVSKVLKRRFYYSLDTCNKAHNNKILQLNYVLRKFTILFKLGCFSYYQSMTYLGLVALLSFLGYALTNKRSYTRTLKTRLDSYIHYNSLFVIPYVLLFPYLVLPLFLLETHYLRGYLLSTTIANCLASVIWYFFPNGVSREPRIENTGVLNRLMNYIYKHDGDTNGFPSGHVFMSTIISYYLFLQQGFFGYIVLGFLIAISTVFTKQHYVVDILGGLVMAVIAIGTAGVF